MSQAIRLNSQTSGIHSTRLHVYMYAMLLIATPFILLRNYLVQGIAYVSSYSIMLSGIELKVVPISAMILALCLLIVYRSYITKIRALSLVIGIAIIGLAQQITDYYFGHNFYDLQQNWHYLAYGIYSYIIYRDLASRRLSLFKIILITYFSAMLLSTFDEIIQVYISSRVFDICDIGKDVAGVYMGMTITYFSGNYSQPFFKDWDNIRHKKIKAYYRHPFTLMLLLFALTFIFLGYGSILSNSQYWFHVIALTVISFAVVFIILHLSQFKTPGYIMLAVFIILIVVQGFYFIKHRGDGITKNEYGLTVYKGIPIPFFDIIIFPNGGFRLVDKKHSFNQRDREFLLRKKTDIILIGSGAYGRGGKGFNNPAHEFLYNPYTKKATQVIIQKNSEACKTFNRLKRENKNVLFVLHNTC